MKKIFALIKFFSLSFILLGMHQQLHSQEVGVNSIVITFESAPTASVTKAALKYNKNFALSYHIEDGSKDVYTHAFQYLNGGTIGSTTYPGKFFTDGCGNDVPFKMSSSVFSFNNDQDTDLHDVDGENTDTYLSWPEIIELYQAGWGIYNQGLTSSNSGDQDYLIGRNHSYIKLKTQDATNNGIDPKIFVNPQGDISFSSPAFDLGYIAAFRPYAYGVPYLDVSIPATITDIDSLKMGRTNLVGTVSLGKLADSLNAHSDDSDHQWSSAYNKSVNGGAGGYTFNVFKFYIDYIAANYGKAGADNIWMASEEEVLEYLTLYELIDINTEILGNQMLITFDGDLPTDFRFYALSLLINSDVRIIDINVNGGENISYTNVAQLDTTKALINLNWDGKVVVSKTVNAENYVSIAESTEDQNDILIAMDYVNMLESGQTMMDFRDRLCAITGADLPDGWCDCSFSLGIDTFICLGDEITLTAPDAVSYEWSTGETTQSINVSPTQHSAYTVTVYNDQGCFSSDTRYVFISNPEFAVTTLNDTVCPNSCIDIAAGGGKSYLWSTGATTPLINVCPTETTTYTVDVSNSLGCIDTDTVTIYTYPEPEIQISNDTSICESDCVSLIVSGGISYLWSTGDTNDTIEVCPDETTTYYVTLTNENNCSITDSVTVTVFNLPAISLANDTNICLNDCIELTASGGTTYLWSTGATTSTIEVCPTDTTLYTVNVFNAAGCLKKDSVRVNVMPIPVPLVSNDTAVCPGTCVELFASGGTSYLWSTGETTDTIQVCPDEPTTYYVNVFNEFGCGVMDSVRVTHLPLTDAHAGSDQTVCPGEQVTLTATGGYTYLWNTGQMTNSIRVTVEDTTTYWVTVTTENRCPATDTVNVFVRPRPIAFAGNDTTICPNECINLEASGGVDYLWNNGTESELNSVCPSQNSDYIVTVYDEFGCSANDTVRVSLLNTEPTYFTGLANVYCSNNPGSLLDGQPGGGIFTGPGVTNNIFYPAIAGVGTHEISYRYENENGCISTFTKTVNVYSAPDISLGNDTTICTDATLMLQVQPGFDSYLWSNGTTNYYTTINSGGLGAHTSTVQLIVTDNGCVTIDEKKVTFISCNVGIEDLQEEGIYMYPNPTTGLFNIRFNTQEKDIKLDIINLQGQIVFSEELIDCNQTECVKTVNLSAYEKGIYIVRFSNKNFIQTAKLLIN